ncbi:MAG: outer membrane lipoprotein-sorting protein [Spirochaetia bacterium]|jgi:outer membrane lipoprotein-sorting protein|nr:outer membrane lipoprotein-sorting protein [Spirochaetia bacterium]
MNKHTTIRSFIVFSLFLFLSSSILFAHRDYSAQQVIDNVYERPTPEDQKAELIMTLENSRGDQRVREIQQYIKDDGEETKKIMFFTAPADVRNTSFMSFSNDNEKEDSQWIYLPALKKVKRIASGKSSDYFMGSDFTYDDMGERLPSEDTHTIIGEETINGVHCIKVESIPIEKDDMYGKTITWVSDAYWMGLKKDFYDQDGALLKTLTVTDYENIEGYWMITSLKMENVQKDHITLMELNNFVLNSGIKDSDFSVRTMTKGIR